MIHFDHSICSDLDRALRLEWLETNGLGGYASSTIVGLNTRRYHGLLVAATKPPVGRMVLLSKLEETLVVDGRSYDLSANRYPGVVHPQGFRHLQRFRLDPFPIATYEVDGVIHYCVANMPGAVPLTSSYALSNATLPFGLALARDGVNAIASDIHLAAGLNVHRGMLTNRAVAGSLGMEFTEVATALAA